ncbi:2-methylaconitate cis-trans isomerase PrpF family protein [Escherichia fergusonii]|uniref:2-methylaconitate cis-trans isomerase PrpF family protein n=1 Tax=Escherichia fergusonii TaxID=564 RepID=UPI000614739E|nr:PrpF domain-containing protein [Escherichia fergusonii]EHG6159486.1 PrpF protein [Escherichia fergusonii]EHK3067150.1 PrpF protein [Escherichia fergusonii]EHK3072122.1 PrpF protein [Escherichia fergusonii]EIQ6797270.1 PrpF protein [Escherichia fergusonii]EJB0947230.1 PrpF protein [Escherichia fergusonii]
MRKFKTVFMRGGTSKGCMFLKDFLPADRAQWDSIFLQVMGDPDPKQIDGMGGTVSSNNKIVIVWKSELPGVDVEYLVGQVIAGKSQVDYKSNCGNMTAAVGPFAIEEGLLPAIAPITTVRMLNHNTGKRIDITVPCENGGIALDGDCQIAGVDGTAPELKVNFLNPAGSKTGKLLPTGNTLDVLTIPGLGEIEATILDISNPMVLVRAEDLGLTGTELPEEINQNNAVCELLENIRGTAACMMGFANNLDDARENSPAVPKVGMVTVAKSYPHIANEHVDMQEMDICARVISVFKCHKACPLTSASAISVAAFLPGSLVQQIIPNRDWLQGVRIGHPSGVMTMYPSFAQEGDDIAIPGVAVQRTARRIMDGTVYIRN